jgi:hypothetical protein
MMSCRYCSAPGVSPLAAMAASLRLEGVSVLDMHHPPRVTASAAT